MGKNEMQEVAALYARVLLHNENPSAVKKDVQTLKSDFQIIRYCFNESQVSGYPL
jgi:glycine/serine hydroxymethyltransferase